MLISKMSLNYNYIWFLLKYKNFYNKYRNKMSSKIESEEKIEEKMSEIKIELQLGDVIRIKDPTSEKLNGNTFYIDYLDQI